MARAKKPALRWDSICTCGHPLGWHSSQLPGSWESGPRTPAEASLHRCQTFNDETGVRICDCRRFADATAANDATRGAA